MMGFWNRLFGKKQSSSQIAKDRLQLVLVHDRFGLSEETISKMQEEIINVLSRYADIDQENMDISLIRGRGQNKLIANIPLHPQRVPSRV